jgi:hypothetical protein
MSTVRREGRGEKDEAWACLRVSAPGALAAAPADPARRAPGKTGTREPCAAAQGAQQRARDAAQRAGRGRGRRVPGARGACAARRGRGSGAMGARGRGCARCNATSPVADCRARSRPAAHKHAGARVPRQPRPARRRCGACRVLGAAALLLARALVLRGAEFCWRALNGATRGDARWSAWAVEGVGDVRGVGVSAAQGSAAVPGQADFRGGMGCSDAVDCRQADA